MSILPNLLRSLIITSIVSFLAPALFLGVIILLLTAIGLIPHLEVIGQVGTQQILNFLAVFGSGSALEGLMVIGIVCSLVGALFDTFSRYQNFRSD